MEAFIHDGTNKDFDVMEDKSEETVTSRNTGKSLLKTQKLKASLKEKEITYNCKECGKQMSSQSSLYSHIRAIHEGIKYLCVQCQHQATSKGHLAQHI